MKLTPAKKPSVKIHNELGLVLVIGSAAHPTQGLLYGVRRYQPDHDRFAGTGPQVHATTLSTPDVDDAQALAARQCLARSKPR